MKLLSPEYWAVIELEPAGKDDVDRLAVPPDVPSGDTVPEPSKVQPL